MYQINIKIKNVVDFKMVGVSEICYEHAKKYLLQWRSENISDIDKTQ